MNDQPIRSAADRKVATVERDDDERAALAEPLTDVIAETRLPRLPRAAAGDRRRARPAAPGPVREFSGGRLALAALALVSMVSLAAAQAPTGCTVGQPVTDDRNNSGVIVGGRDEMCLIKYKDGQTQGWVSATRLSAVPPAKSGTPAAGTSPPAPTIAAPTGPEGVKVVRPTVVNRLVYHADALGHIALTANVNGAPVRFIVDTGATLVSLTPGDANAAGIKRGELTFDQTVDTGNGPVHAAFVQLREIRIDQLEVGNVQAAVIDSLKQSVLGMSLLNRLKGFEMHNGVLTMNW
jgi:aspartyl protease family protein